MTLSFTPPDDQTWELDPVHQPRPWSRFMTELYPEPFARGFAAGTADHGLLLDRRRIKFIHGFGFLSLDLVSADRLPERIGQLVTLFERKPWRESLRVWDEEVKPSAIAANRALQAIDPAELTTPALLDHIARCREHLAEMVYQHMRFTIAALLPVGDFMAHAAQWTGLGPAALLGLLRGASPVSAGTSAELDRLVAALRASPAVLDGGLEALLATQGEVGAAARAWIELVGWRLIDGLDLADNCAIELPDLMLRTVRAAIERSPVRTDPSMSVRDRVPAADRATFDELLAEARRMYRLRDERGVFCDVWASGLTRRALLAAGARLAANARIERAEHLVDATWDEVRALLTSSGGPSADELSTRAAFRTSHDASAAPGRLGPEPTPPPLDALPLPARRAVIAIMTSIGALFGESESPGEGAVVQGLAASAGTCEGTARVIRNPEELARLQRGDVLVTISTSEAFNLALPLLGAIVTDRGGTLSHAAIVSREFGIPCVVGTRRATSAIRDGSRIRVDGTTGEVHLL